MDDSKKINFLDVLRELSTGEPLADDLMATVIAEIDRHIRHEPNDYDWPNNPKAIPPGISRDDAWDATDKLKPQHNNALPYLNQMIQDVGSGTSDDLYAQAWAIRAISKIGGDISLTLPCLLQVIEHDTGRLRKEAIITLKKCGYKHLIK